MAASIAIRPESGASAPCNDTCNYHKDSELPTDHHGRNYHETVLCTDRAPQDGANTRRGINGWQPSRAQFRDCMTQGRRSRLKTSTVTLPWNSPELSVAATTKVTGSSSCPSHLLCPQHSLWRRNDGAMSTTRCSLAGYVLHGRIIAVVAAAPLEKAGETFAQCRKSR